MNSAYLMQDNRLDHGGTEHYSGNSKPLHCRRRIAVCVLGTLIRRDVGQKPTQKLGLKEGECMGACGDAPVLLVNNHHMCSWMTTEKIDQMLAELDKK